MLRRKVHARKLKPAARFVSPFSAIAIVFGTVDPIQLFSSKFSTQPARVLQGLHPGLTKWIMTQEPHWLQWAREIQAIAQTGMHFSESPYDRERYQRLLELAVDIFGQHSNLDAGPIRAIFNQETGYATPKVDVRGVVFRDDTILLVRERADGRWTLPGGWADVNDSPSEAVEREIREESGFEAKASRLLAVYDRAKHAHHPLFAYHVYKLFILCNLTGGLPTASMETSEVGFFGENQLPPLSEERVLPAQIAFCFRQRLDPHAQPYFD